MKINNQNKVVPVVHTVDKKSKVESTEIKTSIVNTNSNQIEQTYSHVINLNLTLNNSIDFSRIVDRRSNHDYHRHSHKHKNYFLDMYKQIYELKVEKERQEFLLNFLV